MHCGETDVSQSVLWSYLRESSRWTKLGQKDELSISFLLQSIYTPQVGGLRSLRHLISLKAFLLISVYIYILRYPFLENAGNLQAP